MASEWHELSKVLGGQPFTIERVRLSGKGIAVEGNFEPPPLARLSFEDQVFVAAFVRSHGSIKEMEDFFGVSYPTIKNRLNHISKQLEFIEIVPTPPRSEILAKLERGQISAGEAIQLLNQTGGERKT
ncbi:MAG TPA: DUF2089 domain-containing protein [Acidobacteriota bacterium]|jgi:hypothetical protein